MAMTQRSARDLVTDITTAIEDGEYDPAVRAAAWGVEAYPDAAVFHRLRGTALVALGANEEAKADLALALAVDPLDHEALVTLSRLEEAEGDLYTAAEHLLTAWEHDPANGLLRSDLTYRLARLYGSEGYLQYTRPALAALYVRNSYPERAAREYAAALAEQPTRVDLRLASVLARWRLNALAETVDGCVLLLDEQPQLVRARWALADALARRGQGEQAREHAKHAALLDPDGAIARAMIEGNTEATIVDPDEMVRVSADIPHTGPRVTELQPDEMPAPVPPMAPTYVPSFDRAPETDMHPAYPTFGVVPGADGADTDVAAAYPTFGALPDAGDNTRVAPAPASPGGPIGNTPTLNADTAPAHPTFEALPDDGDGTLPATVFPEGFEDDIFIAPRVEKPLEDEVIASPPWELASPAVSPPGAIAAFAAADAADTVVDVMASPPAPGIAGPDASAAVVSVAADTVAPDATPPSAADAAAMPPGRDAEPEPVIVVPTETGEILTTRPGDEPLLDATDALLKAMNTLEASVEPEMSAVEHPTMAALPAIPDVPPTAVTSIQAAPEGSAFVAAPEIPDMDVTSIQATAPAPEPMPVAPAPPVTIAPQPSPVPLSDPTIVPLLSSPGVRRPPAHMDPWAAMQARLEAGDAAGAVTLGRAALASAGREQDQVRLLLPAMRSLVDAEPNRPDTRRLLGDTYRRLGQVAQAQGQYQQALLTRIAGKR